MFVIKTRNNHCFSYEKLGLVRCYIWMLYCFAVNRWKNYTLKCCTICGVQLQSIPKDSRDKINFAKLDEIRITNKTKYLCQIHPRWRQWRHVNTIPAWQTRVTTHRRNIRRCQFKSYLTFNRRLITLLTNLIKDKGLTIRNPWLSWD